MPSQLPYCGMTGRPTNCAYSAGTEELGEGVIDPDGVAAAVDVLVLVGDADLVDVAVAVTVFVDVAVAVAVEEKEDEAVDVCVGEAVAVDVEVAVEDDVDVDVEVLVAVPVAVTDAVDVPVAVAVGVALTAATSAAGLSAFTFCTALLLHSCPKLLSPHAPAVPAALLSTPVLWYHPTSICDHCTLSKGVTADRATGFT